MSRGFEELQRLAARLDASGMLDLVASFPSQMNDAWTIANGFARALQKTPARAVVVCGMGGSAIGGDMVRGFLGDRLRVPLHVNRSHTVPRGLVPEGFFVFSSYSGNTEETLSAYRGVRASGRPSVAITSGGELSRLCKADGVPVCEIPGGMPPRAAIAYSFFPLLGIVAALGLADVNEEELDEARKTLEAACRLYRSSDPANRAVEVAHRLAGMIPVVYAGAGLLEAVARRWCNQLNENGKSLAHYALFPELTHNEIVGWGVAASLREHMVVIRLDDADDGTAARRQAAIAMELIGPQCAGVIDVSGLEGGRLTRILSAMILGDFVSVYLAFLNGVDPTPVESIDTLKRRLRQAG
jgi:glucose/mannose-6-phosphate isomerase